LNSIVLNPGVKEMLVDDAKDFLQSERWYMDRGIPFRRGYLLYGVPGSGKSSLIHALAGFLQLDIYVVSLSASWISDSTLTSLMGRVPARCVVLLEDLDAAFTRSTSRDDDEEELLNSDNKKSATANNHSSSHDETSGGFGSAFGYSSRRRSGHRRSGGGDYLSDVNTLSLSGLLNALDGVAAAEGRLLFATTNHLEKLDPALSRPGRMDVWIEFKNASRWQAEALFRNFFPCEEDEEETEAKEQQETRETRERREREVEEAMKSIKVEMSPAESRRSSQVYSPVPPTPTDDKSHSSSASSGSLWSLASSATSLIGASSGLSGVSSNTSTASSSPLVMAHPLPSWSMPTIGSSAPSPLSSPVSAPSYPSPLSSTPPLPSTTVKGFGSSNTAYPRPEVDADVAAKKHSAAPLDRKTLAVLAKQFADGVPEEEFSVASLQGCESTALFIFRFPFSIPPHRPLALPSPSPPSSSVIRAGICVVAVSGCIDKRVYAW
jgi:chaperone BCS1